MVPHDNGAHISRPDAGVSKEQRSSLCRFYEGRPGNAVAAIFHGQNLFKVVLVLLSLFLYVIFMETVGFIPLTVLLFIFLLGIIEKKRWFFTVFVSVVVTAISYLIFEVWLQCMLPRGLLESLRF